MNAPVERPASTFVNLGPGDPAPWFRQRSTSGDDYAFDTAAGRYVVLCFFVSAAEHASRTALQDVITNRHLFDDQRASFFGVSVDPRDEAEARVRENLPGIRFFWDHDGAVSRRYGCMAQNPDPKGGNAEVHPLWVVLDPMLRVLRTFYFSANGNERAELFKYLQGLPPPDRFAGFEIPPPILVLPNVFEPSFCKHLIDQHKANCGPEPDPFRKPDPAVQRQKDFMVAERELVEQIAIRLGRRVKPELLKVFAFNATRMEHYVVSCGLPEDGDTPPRRDNTTNGTGHRRFTVSINLNDEFIGGEISFPEYGKRRYKAGAGCAVVYPCALLHAVTKISLGRRYEFSPFLFDEAAAQLRAPGVIAATAPAPG